jgi:hypothetical protein
MYSALASQLPGAVGGPGPASRAAQVSLTVVRHSDMVGDALDAIRAGMVGIAR